MNSIDWLLRQLDHERWANDGVIAALASVDAPRRVDERFGRAVDKVAHTLAAREMWLFRMGGRALGPDHVFPEGETLESLAPRSHAVLDAWAAWLRRAGVEGVEGLDRPFDYKDLKGTPYRNTYLDVVQQVYTHGFYHRGQVGSLLNQLGVQPPLVDYIFFVREAR